MINYYLDRRHALYVNVCAQFSKMEIHVIILFAFSTNVFGQGLGDKHDYYKHKMVTLKPAKFNLDSTPTLIYVKKNAEIYFKQSDVRDYIHEEIRRDSTYKMLEGELLNLVNGDKIKIEVVDFLFEFWTSKEIDSLKSRRLTNDYSNLINHWIEFIGADLIYEGKFMLYEPSSGRFVEKGLKGKWQGAQIGSTTWDYLLPDRRKFYSLITSFVD
jgi:hypothetical protein